MSKQLEDIKKDMKTTHKMNEMRFTTKRDRPHETDEMMETTKLSTDKSKKATKDN